MTRDATSRIRNVKNNEVVELRMITNALPIITNRTQRTSISATDSSDHLRSKHRKSASVPHTSPLQKQNPAKTRRERGVDRCALKSLAPLAFRGSRILRLLTGAAGLGVLVQT